MSKISNDAKIFEKYFVDGCMPSPPDSRDYTRESVCLTAQPIPETYLSTGMKVLNQGSVGSCVAHACATALGYGEKLGGNAPHDYSRGFIYGNRRVTDHQGEGMYLRQALKQLNHCGDCEYVDFPYNEVYPKVKARIEADKENLLAKAEPYKIVNYFRCYTDEDVKLALLNQGAVVISIPVYSSFAADCPIPSADDTYRGGHAMCVVGWDETGWIIQNSWSASWGKKGLLHLPYKYPINEFWGITVNPTVPQPKEEKWYVKLWKAICAFFKRYFRNIDAE
jgi:C1A family cysteine protease